MARYVAVLVVLLFITAFVIKVNPISKASAVENTWTAKSPLPQELDSAEAAVANGKIYLMGSFYKNSSYSYFNYEYDPETNNWVAKTLKPTPKAISVVVSFQNKMYTMGERLGYTKENGTLYGCTNEVYDPATDTWTLGEPMPTSRGSPAVAVVNDQVYVIGGTINMYYRSQANELYTPIGYGAPDPSYDTTAPKITFSSPENKIYYTSNVTLCFAVNETTSQISYSLDGRDNVTVAGNTTLAGLNIGVHNVTVYAWDKFGNVGASAIVAFTIAEPEPEFSPTTLVVVASVVLSAVVGVSLLFYFKKRKH